MDETAESMHVRLRRGPGHMRALFARRWVRVLAVLALLAGVAAGGFWMVFARDLPSAESLLAYEPALPTNVRDINGQPVYAFMRERRVELSFDEFPKVLVGAFLSAEDKTFFEHGGIDYLAFGNGVFEYLTKMGSGERARGGSTITQQLAKILLVGDEYSPARKIREAILARRIEAALTKQQILELYLNQIFLGRNAYGVQSAARAYFDKDVGQLTLPEAAYLAVLPKAPSTLTPERHADRALARRGYVLRQMEANGYITAAQRAEADAAPLGTVAKARPPKRPAGGYFLEDVRRELIAKYGEKSDKGPYSVYDGGLWVRTSLDPKVQKAAEDALRDGLMRYDAGRGWRGAIATIDAGDLGAGGAWRTGLVRANVGVGYDDWRAAVVLDKAGSAATIGFTDGSTGTLPAWGAAMPRRGIGGTAFRYMKAGDIIAVKRQGGDWVLRNIPEVSGAMVAEDPHTGRVLAMQGGFDERGNDFNRATQAMRQPGSSFKPFVYASALDAGMTPATKIMDAPFCVYQSARLGRKCFVNFGGARGAGLQTMRWGVEQSRNLMTVRAASQTGMNKIVATAKAMDIGTYPAVLAISLGAGDTTVAKLTNAYAMLANQGRSLKPTLIDLIQDRHGKTIFRADMRPCERCNMKDWDGKPMPRPRVRTKQAMDAMTAYQTVHILEGVVQRGTATTLRDLNRPLFGKTGTSTGPTNVWFVGGSQDLVAGVYMGFDKPRPMGGYAQGGTLAAPIFKQFAKVAMADMPVVPFKAPPGIRMVRIDRRSGRKVYGTWPTNDPLAPVIWEAFKPESEPRRSIRRSSLAARGRPKDPVAAEAEAATARRAQRAKDADFMERQGGIY